METLRTWIARWIDPQVAGDIALLWAGRILAAALILLIGRSVARALTAWFRRAVLRVRMDETLSRFLGSVIYVDLEAHGMSLTHIAPPPPRISSRAAESA